ncbi:GDSL-type esterase/lipase family protein [Flavihumibacter rivuli]|uniref:GDSL-type esterase/lipase family protein n=1 Tax=Flavihumibacter rivuli TaxID=2838156 RepID=UPI001BDF1C2E|nr:GDSL-type esterase/lipase family protein [Flavihumibacter rivuli]ULQ56959.1 GDSL-type esterase/lipase family protein [Flavihumibacter rivuli]
MSATAVAQQPTVIDLYPGKAPGSESWDWKEKDTVLGGIKSVINVVKPTLTVYPSTGSIPTGTSVIIAPGGGFHFLSIYNEGEAIARKLNQLGITAFVLKYRTVHTEHPIEDGMKAQVEGRYNEVTTPILKLAMQDAQTAISMVRKEAAKWNISPSRIGLMGFSAGGTVAISTAYQATGDAQPDFIVPVYAADFNIMVGSVPGKRMPAYFAVAADDPLKLAPGNILEYHKWRSGGQAAELHVYQNGGHAFSMGQSGASSDQWFNGLESWLGSNGWLWPEKPTGWMANTNYADHLNSLARQRVEVANDWPNLKRFQNDNACLAKMANNGKRVVFMGNSITEGWQQFDSSFWEPSKGYINRGISGQTTPQMLLRFRQDVIDLKPAAVVILAGINDIAGNTGPATIESIFGNIRSMAELARASGIRVIICSVVPANRFPWRPGVQPADKVIELNGLLKAYAAKHKLGYVDYFSAMVDDQKGLKDALTYDGVHPNLAGYKVMGPLVEAVIRKVVK